MPFSAVLPPEKAISIVSKSAGTLNLHQAATVPLHLLIIPLTGCTPFKTFN
jgi:hypothetical protein